MDISGDECHLYWQSVVDTMAEGLFIVDTSGIVVFINPAAERITGYRREEVLGQPCSLFESETCLACRREDGRMGCGLFDHGRVTNKRCTVKRKDGVAVHMLKNATVLTDAHGQVIGGVETLSDISEVVDKDRQINGLRRELTRSYGFEGMLGESKLMTETFALLDSAAQSSAPVVILGESGTGKELAAAAIHRRSRRHDGPFIRVNCAALNESLLESELFGHEKGAFTGAERLRRGRFEAADGGSIFLDEIGDMPAPVQVKLLRVLQEGEIERVGSHEPIKVDVRVISATNQDLAQLVAQGKFREDLYYRINVIPVRLPALRERPQDIPLLVDTFIQRMALRSGRAITGLTRAALERFLAYAWPGNVRELINAVEYAFVTCREGEIEPQHLPAAVLGLGAPAAPGVAPAGAPAMARAAAPAVGAAPPPVADDDALRAELMEALALTGGHRAKAAAMLGVSRVTLWKRMKRLGLDA